MNDQKISQRKLSHLELSLKQESQMEFDSFADIQLPYTALPEISLTEVDTSTHLLGKKISQPLIIASMTGGVAHAKEINTHLAEAAQETQIALAVGSQRIALEKPDASSSFTIVRQAAPDAVIFANMAAVQLNYGYTAEHYTRIVDMIQADGVYLHLNPLQEALQSGGDTNFDHLLGKIEKLVKQVPVPVFVKEVGHGISLKVARQLDSIGVSGIDIAGTGGTSWSWIEATNSGEAVLAQWFKEVGYTTAQSLQTIAPEIKTALLVASGGIRNPVQALKARLLGAAYYSAAKPFLEPALSSTQAVIDTIQLWQRGLQVAMFSIGAKNWLQCGE